MSQTAAPKPKKGCLAGFMLLALALGILLFASQNPANPKRSKAIRAEFQRQNPCPSTLNGLEGGRRGPCPGYIADHIKPLACGGADAPENMQWQTAADAKAKDQRELKECGK